MSPFELVLGVILGVLKLIGGLSILFVLYLIVRDA